MKLRGSGILRQFLGCSSICLETIRTLKTKVGLNREGLSRTLIYHDIPPDKTGTFKKQMELAARCYGFIDPGTFMKLMKENGDTAENKLLLTFDDGFKSSRLIAENILEPMGIRAIFFIPTDFVGLRDRSQQKAFIVQNISIGKIDEHEVPRHLEPMDWMDLEHLLLKGHHIGAHTRSHHRLSEIKSKDKLEEEIIGSGDLLEAKLGVPIEYFAYPFGDIASINHKALAVAGRRYRYVFSGVRGRNRHGVHPLALRREAVSLEDDISYYKFILEGGLAPYYYFKRNSLDRMAFQASQEGLIQEKGGM